MPNSAAVPDGHTTVSLIVTRDVLIPLEFVVATCLSLLNTNTVLNQYRLLPDISGVKTCPIILKNSTSRRSRLISCTATLYDTSFRGRAPQHDNCSLAKVCLPHMCFPDDMLPYHFELYVPVHTILIYLMQRVYRERVQKGVILEY